MASIDNDLPQAKHQIIKTAINKIMAVTIMYDAGIWQKNSRMIPAINGNNNLKKGAFFQI